MPDVAACGGSWMATGAMPAAGRFEEISRVAAEARAIVRRVPEDSAGGG